MSLAKNTSPVKSANRVVDAQSIDNLRLLLEKINKVCAEEAYQKAVLREADFKHRLRFSMESNWRSQFNVKQRWAEARRKSLFTDVNFLVGKGKMEKTFSAHKNILAFSSSIFERMFYGLLPEKNDPVKIPNVEPVVFEALLRYVYGEDIKFISISFVAKMYLVAEEFLMPDLHGLVVRHIQNRAIDAKQFWDIIFQDKYLAIPVIKTKCFDFIEDHASLLFESCLFIKLPYDIIKEILQMDIIDISEYELLSALVRWCMYNIQADTELKTKIEPLIRYIRFSIISVDDFCSFLECHPGLIDVEDSLSIMKHLHCNSYDLPEWCSTSSKERSGITA